MRLYLVRHGETIWNIESKFQGWADMPLSKRGEQQAEEIREKLRDVTFDAVYSSGLQRARRTAEIIVGQRDLTVKQIPQLREMGLGELEGLTEAQIIQKFPGELEKWRADIADHVLPGGESLRAVQERCWPEVQRIAKEHQGHTVLLVAHHTVNKTIIGTLLDLPFQRYRILRQPACTVNLLEITPTQNFVHAVNLNFAEKYSVWHDLDLEKKDVIRNAKAVIFDLDGVLLNSIPSYASAWRCAMAEKGIFPPEIEFYRREGERGVESIKHFFAEAGRETKEEEIEQILNRVTELYYRYPAPEVFQDAMNMVAKLKKNGYKTAVVTGSPRNDVENRLSIQQQKLFDTMVTQYDAKRGKPYPDPYQQAIKNLGIESHEAIVVENAPFGIRSAKSAGILTLGLTTTLPREELVGADLIIDNVSRLSGWLGLEE